MHHAVGIGVAHGDVDVVLLFQVGQGVEGGDEQLLVGQHQGCALSLLGGEPFGVGGEQLAGVFALQDVLRAVYDGDVFGLVLEARRPFGFQLGEVLHVLVEEVSGLAHLVGFQVVDVAVRQQVAYAAAHIFADDSLFAARQGVEPHEVDGAVGAVVRQGANLLRHLAVGHAAVGFLVLQKLLAQLYIVLVQRTVELQVVPLELRQRLAADVPFAYVLQFVDIVEDNPCVDHVLVNLREVAHHQFAERDEVLEGLVFPIRTAYPLVDFVQLEEQELVLHYFQAAQLLDHLVDGRHLWQEGGLPEGVELADEEPLRTVVVEHHQHLVGVLGVVGDDALCYLFQECLHSLAFSRVSGLPTSSQCSALWR